MALPARRVAALPGGQEVMTMPGLMRREPRGEVADVFSRFDHLFEEWARVMPFRAMSFPRLWEAGDLIRVEEFREDGTLVIRADLPGIDPDKDVELTVSDGMLHIGAERREEEKREEKGYLRQEVRYGSLSRSLPLPEGVTEADVTATYEAGVLEIRVPEPKREPARKIAISKA
jgi:HSP20 family protein